MSERAAESEAAAPAARMHAGLPGPAVAALLLVAMGGFLGWAGVFTATQVPDYASSPRQILGMGLMLTLLPPYLVVAGWIAQGRSLALLAELRPRLPQPARADAARDAIRGALRRRWPAGLALGIVLGLMNTNPVASLRGPIPLLEGAISLGQLVLWSLVGILLMVRLAAARAFRNLAEIAPVDLFRPEVQRPLARSGVVDVVIVAGGLLLTPLQSIDAEFRWYNYHFGLLVGLPAVVFFLLWPIQPLHRRSRAARDTRLAEIERQLAALPPEPPATPEASARLEALLAHRDRLRAVRTWPLSTGLLSRVLLYMVIPPLAWAGAALVERIVDRLLSG